MLDYGCDDEQESGSEHEVMFDDATSGVLLAGRVVSCGDQLTRQQVGELFTAITKLGAEQGISLTLVPGGDLSNTGPMPEESVLAPLGVGVIVADGGSYGPQSVAVERVEEQLASVRGVPDSVWQRIGALLPDALREELLQESSALHLLCVGPLSLAHLVFGVEGTEDSAGPGAFVCGQDMEQEKHSKGVWGLEVGSADYQGGSHDRIDWSTEAHAARMSSVPDGRYFLIARFD